MLVAQDFFQLLAQPVGRDGLGETYTTGPTAGHAQDACRLAGYAESSILTRPYDLLARPNVAKAIHEAQTRVRDIAEQEAGISLARVVAQIGRLGFFRVQDLLDDKGALKGPKDWPEDASAAIAGIEMFEEYEGDEGKDRRYKGQTRKSNCFLARPPSTS